MYVSPGSERLTRWLAALEARHLADFTIAEVTRALRALSSAYVQRRHTLSRGAPLDSAGKRAAFALFYGPLHFLTIAHIVESLAAAASAPQDILDLGCGTGVAGAAWAVCGGATSDIFGVDRHPWAVDETRRTYRDLGIPGRARLADMSAFVLRTTADKSRRPPSTRPDAIVVAYALNELPDTSRRALETRLLSAAERGTRVLIVEPIARGVTPWWKETAARVKALGGRTDEWRFPADLPPLLRLLDKAAGLHHEELTARTFYLG